MGGEVDDNSKGLRVREFFEIEAKTLQERFRVIETLLPAQQRRGSSHAAEEGRFIESLLRDFLNKHLPKDLRAVSGFILCPATKTGISDVSRLTENPDRHSRQLDIIVYDFASFPVYEHFEEFCIVPPEGVIGIISVKKTLYKKAIRPEIEALKSATDLCATHKKRGPFTALLAFTADECDDAKLNREIFEPIHAIHSGENFDTMINEVSVMERTCAFKIRSDDAPPGFARYVAVDCRERHHIPLQRLLQSLLSVFYDKTRGSAHSRPGFVSFEKETFKRSPELGLVRYSSTAPGE